MRQTASGNRTPQQRREAEARTRHEQAAAEVSAYGGTPVDFRVNETLVGPFKGSRRYRTAEYQVQPARDTALRVNQREQLRKQNQEIQELQLSGKKRRRGRGSLLAYIGSQNKGSLGPSGTLQ